MPSGQRFARRRLGDGKADRAVALHADAEPLSAHGARSIASRRAGGQLHLQHDLRPRDEMGNRSIPAGSGRLPCWQPAGVTIIVCHAASAPSAREAPADRGRTTPAAGTPWLSVAAR